MKNKLTVILGICIGIAVFIVVGLMFNIFNIFGEPAPVPEETTTQTQTTTQPEPEETTTQQTTTGTTPASDNTQTDVTQGETTAVSSEKTEKVWATGDVNIRTGPSTDYEKIGKLHEGNSIERTEALSNGWSKVIYNGETAYISSSYLTKNEPSFENITSDRILVNPDTDLWNLIVVNTTREIPADYVPQLAEVVNSGVYLDYRVAPYYNDMYAAAKKDGITLVPYSGYRSYARQQRNYNNLTETYMSDYNLSRKAAAQKAATVILPPGTSEHNLGLAMDICNTNSTFKNQKEYAWLTEHAHEYGFILRYTAEKQSITGIIPEPWHWRFVGVEYAEKIKNSGLCLEEYLDSVGISY